MAAIMFQHERSPKSSAEAARILGLYDGIHPADQVNRWKCICRLRFVYRGKTGVFREKSSSQKSEIERQTQPDEKAGQCRTLAEAEDTVETLLAIEQRADPFTSTRPPFVARHELIDSVPPTKIAHG